MNQFQKDFSKGYFCAVANYVRMNGVTDTMAKELFRCNSMSIKTMKEMGIDKDDIKVLKPLVKEINRRNKL